MDQTDVGLQSIVKALNDTVAGAIDPKDHLAKEQLRLAVGYVEFVRKRLHLIHARERFDLKHHVALAHALLRIEGCPDAEAAQVRQELSRAEPALADAGALTGEIRQLTMDLAHAVAGVVQAAHRASLPAAGEIDRAVIAASEDKMRMERLWYEPIGFEPAPLTGASLEDCLR